MSVVQFLRSLSDLMWAFFWVIVIFLGSKNNIGDDTSFKLRVERNRVTGETE